MKLKSILLLIVALICACGKDGQDGRAFLSFSWDTTYLLYYEDNNPKIPSIIRSNTDYETDGGNYEFYYELASSTKYIVYEGYYTINKNKGEKGSFIVDGKDGSDKHYRLNLGWYGISLNGTLLENKDNDNLYESNQHHHRSLNLEGVDYESINFQDDQFRIIIKYRKMESKKQLSR